MPFPVRPTRRRKKKSKQGYLNVIASSFSSCAISGTLWHPSQHLISCLCIKLDQCVPERIVPRALIQLHFTSCSTTLALFRGSSHPSRYEDSEGSEVEEEEEDVSEDDEVPVDGKRCIP